MIKSKQRWWLTADRSCAVPEGHPEAAYLLVGAGCLIREALLREYGIHPEQLAKKTPRQTKTGTK